MANTWHDTGTGGCWGYGFNVHGGDGLGVLVAFDLLEFSECVLLNFCISEAAGSVDVGSVRQAIHIV
jgi:hypothetical protein